MNATLPVIRRALGSDVATIEWVVTVYLLVVSGLLLSLAGWVTCAGTSASMSSASASSSPVRCCAGWRRPQALVLGRAVQAVGGAMLFANSAAILTTNFPPERSGRTLGLQATMTYLGLMTGPSLGGLLASWLGWRHLLHQPAHRPARGWR